MNMCIMYMNDLFEFQTLNNDDGEVITGGGISVEKFLKENSKDGNMFHRFKNLVVPIGLPLHNIEHSGISYNDSDDIDNENAALITSKKFDDLLYSVGSDLGIVKTRTSKNKTQKITK